MTIGKWARLLCVGAPMLAGCANFWQVPGSSTTGGCTTNCTTANSGDFYILNTGTTPQIIGESIVTGVLTPISGSPYSVTGTPTSMAIAPNGNFLCVSTSSGVFAYPIVGGVLGTVTQISTDVVSAIQIDRSSSWLVEAIPVTGSTSSTNGVQLEALLVNSTTGAYTGTGTPPSATFNSIAGAVVQQNQMVISGDNDNIFVALNAGGVIAVPFASAAPFPAGISATVIPVAHSGGFAVSVAVDPGQSPRLFYAGETLGNSAGTSGGLYVYNYSSLGSAGGLTQATGSPIASGGLAPNFILPVASGTEVYVADGGGNIYGFAVASTGTSTAPAYTISTGSTVAAGTQPIGMAQDSTGSFLLELNSGGAPYLDTYTFDTTTTGKLDVQIVANTGASPIAIVAP